MPALWKKSIAGKDPDTPATIVKRFQILQYI